MAPAKMQQANGAKKCENGRPKTVRNRAPKVQKQAKNAPKRSKTGENRRKHAKQIGTFIDDLFFGNFPLAI